MNTPHTAMILAAGLGTRMLPLTEHTPKPLVTVCGKTLLDYRVEALCTFGIQHIVINCFHLADQIAEHITHYRHVKITLIREEERLETGGGVVNALPHLGHDPFFVLNSDMIWLDPPKAPTALARMAKAWQEETMDALLLLQEVQHARGYHGKGDFYRQESGQLIPCMHVPQTTTLSNTTPFIYAGMQLLHPRALPGYKAEPFSLNQVFASLYQQQRLYGLPHLGNWLHVDSIASRKEAEAFLQQHT